MQNGTLDAVGPFYFSPVKGDLMNNLFGVP